LLYTTAAGISPSGVVHFGNFRDIITSHAVAVSLQKKGKNARLLFSWDNFDRLRKVPLGVPESFSEHIGKPLSYVPDPANCHTSYAEHFQAPFEEAMQKLGMPVEYRNQTTLYESGVYDAHIFNALKKRYEIADVLLSAMTEKAMGEKGIVAEEYREAYYPISVYSRFSGTDNTKVLSYDGNTTITYYCADTKQNDTVDLSKDHIAKLQWKVDWPMRWKYEGVVFEPGGHDHASPGGSYDTASKLSPAIFNYDAPVFVEYKFVGIQGLGAKMSGSKGNAISPLELLEIYEPELLTWLYQRKSPDQSFQLAFDSETYRQYEEYDTEHPANAIPFRQAVGFGQIVQWDTAKLAVILEQMKLAYTPESVARRLPLARNWLTKYNPDDVIELRNSVNTDYAAAMTDTQKGRVHALRTELATLGSPTIEELEKLLYAIPRTPDLDEAALKKEQRAFFKDVYNLLITRDTGPRLGTFLWAIDRSQVEKLLSL
jgi:lysyl-tRNA synthetase class 1